jgi:hypothetical protein
MQAVPRVSTENTEEDIDMISFRKTNTSVDDNVMDFENADYILVAEQHRGKLGFSHLLH